MKPLKLRGVTLGTGAPKIIASVAGASREELLARTAAAKQLPIDMIEWRADGYAALTDADALMQTACALRTVLDDTPLLFTVRTAAEGGTVSLSPEKYAAVNRTAAQSGAVDLVDVELSHGGAEEALRAVHDLGLSVLASFHDFHATPPQEQLLDWLRRAQKRAEVTKIAVMPQTSDDVLALLRVSRAMRERYAERPYVTISMGALGAISRVVCAWSGSCMTFGAAQEASAPGQLSVTALKAALDALAVEKCEAAV